jgi:hypothetical protein
MFDNEYVSLEKVAGQLNLPQRYLRELTNAGKIAHLLVGGRLRYQVKGVREALSLIEHQPDAGRQLKSKSAILRRGAS